MLQLLSLECPRDCAPQQERPLRREARTRPLGRSPRSLQLEKGPPQQRPSTAERNKIKERKRTSPHLSAQQSKEVSGRQASTWLAKARAHRPVAQGSQPRTSSSAHCPPQRRHLRSSALCSPSSPSPDRPTARIL